MLAIEISQPGGPEVLRPVERPVPEPQAGELLVRVSFAGVNRPDIMQRLGKYPPPQGASDIPGLEIAGTVVASNATGSRFETGARVCALGRWLLSLRLQSFAKPSTCHKRSSPKFSM